MRQTEVLATTFESREIGLNILSQYFKKSIRIMKKRVKKLFFLFCFVVYDHVISFHFHNLLLWFSTP